MRTRAIGIALFTFALACARGGAPEPAKPGVRALVLPTDQPPLAQGSGRDQFYASCVTCHSTRYVTDQPRFARKTWTAEVDKMMKSYGAPVPAEHVAAIVDYLVAVNGSE